jgi:uncharacterized delta-60 repeat protein
MSKLPRFIAIAIIWFGCSFAVAQTGDCYAVLAGCLDSSFGNGTGKVTTAVPNTRANVAAVGVQDVGTPSVPDRRIVAVGSAAWTTTQGKFQIWKYAWIVARYDQSGNLDTSFGSNGTGIVKNTNNAVANGVAIQPDNKILVAGSAPNSKGYVLFTVARYGVNGLPDTSFGTGGLVQIPVTVGACSSKNNGGSGDANGIAVQSDGKIVVAGRCFGDHLGVVRLNSNGTLDATFGTSGQFVYSGAAWATPWAPLALDSTQRIVVAGSVLTDSTTGVHTNALLRLTAKGSLDTSFGASGVVVTKFLDHMGYNMSVGIDASDRVLTTGNSLSTTSLDSERMVLARYNTDGTLDTSFNGSGFLIGSPVLDFDYGTAVGLQTDGKILVGGSERTLNGGYFAAWRFNADGSPDVNFGTNGEVTTSLAADNQNFAYAAAQQSDRKLVLGGLIYVNGIGQFGLARYWR